MFFHFRRRVSFGSAVLAVCGALFSGLSAGCGGGGGGGSKTAPTPTPTPPPVPTNATKATLRGLVAMGPATKAGAVPANAFAELYAHPGVYSAAVIQLYWSQLEPSQGVFDDTALNAALAGIAAYNAKYPATPVVGKLRIFAGMGTPAWVITATGGVTLTGDSGTLTVGEFWTPAYRTFWQGLQAHLASEYDSSPAIGEVAITSCSTLTGEPFILPRGTAAIAALHQAGYTDAQGMACLSGAADDYAAWKNTPLDYTFNAFAATDTGAAVSNTAFPIQVMDAFRANLGTRAVVANHGLQTTLNTDAPPLYAEFQNLYNAATAAGTISPLEFQTVSPTVDWPSTIALGLTFHPTEIEVWDTTAAGGTAPLSQSQLQDWATSLK